MMTDNPPNIASKPGSSNPARREKPLGGGPDLRRGPTRHGVLLFMTKSLRGLPPCAEGRARLGPHRVIRSTAKSLQHDLRHLQQGGLIRRVGVVGIAVHQVKLIAKGEANGHPATTARVQMEVGLRFLLPGLHYGSPASFLPAYRLTQSVPGEASKN